MSGRVFISTIESRVAIAFNSAPRTGHGSWMPRVPVPVPSVPYSVTITGPLRPVTPPAPQDILRRQRRFAGVTPNKSVAKKSVLGALNVNRLVSPHNSPISSLLERNIPPMMEIVL